MAPTPSPILAHLSSPSSRRLHRLRYQALSSSYHPPGKSSVSRTGRPQPRSLDVVPRLPVALEAPPPPPIAPTLSESPVLPPEPSAIPVRDNEPQEPNQPGDVPGNIVAAVVVVVLILGGLIGLVVGGEMLRRGARTTRQRVSPPPSRCFGRRNPKKAKNATRPPQQRIKTSRERSPYDDKTLTPVTRPPPVLHRERQRRFSDVWPIRNFSRARRNRRSRQEQVEHSVQHPPPVASPQTTWSDFSPVSHYVTPTRTILSRIPEELEDCQSQTDIEVILGVTLQRSPESSSLVSAPQTKQPKSHGTFLEGPDGWGPSVPTERRGLEDCQTTYKTVLMDEDTKSSGSSAPDMTSDEDESSRSSMESLESLEAGNDGGSLKEEVFELRRAQTRSMQMNKGVLLSLSLKTLDDGQNLGPTHGELGRGPSRDSTAPDADCGEREMSLAILGGTFSAVNLDEFPSPPSILPMIPSLVSNF